MKKSSRLILTAGLLLLLLGGYWMVSFRLKEISLAEPDRYFHLALARMTAERGLVDAIPQIDNLSWKNEYPNGYFLFSTINGLLYRFGGERAVLAVVPVLAGIFLTLLFCILQTLVPLPI